MPEKLAERLKPCPFCGRKAEAARDVSRFRVGCLNGACLGFIGLSWRYPTQEKAIAAWNRRAYE